MEDTKRLLEFLEALEREGRAVKETRYSATGNWVGGAPQYVDLQLFKKWQASCQLLVPMLGTFGETWRAQLTADLDNQNIHALSLLGTVEAIHGNVKAGRLFRFEDLAVAEVFADLSSQAEYLLEQGYHMAAGVLFRAVLEEKLRRMATESAVVPDKDRPTIADFNNALYKASVYDKIALKHVESMAAVGNDAAHAAPGLQAPDVARLGHDVQAFLAKFGS